MTSRQAFGESLRRERERRGVSLQSIADTTKIGASLLAALERGDCSRWPGGIYNRAYVRAYATAAGLDPADVAASFVECFAERADGSAQPGEDRGRRDAARHELRLTLADEPSNRWSLALGRLRSVATDAVVVLTAASALAVALHVDFWMAAAAASLACQAVVTAGAGRSVTALVVELFRSSAASRLAPDETPSDTLAPRSA